MSSGFGQRVYRIRVARSDRFPGPGHEFCHSGPMPVRERLAGYQRKAVARGEPEIELAADQFAELRKADIRAQLIFGVKECCTPRGGESTITGAVEMFLARCGVRR